MPVHRNLPVRLRDIGIPKNRMHLLADNIVRYVETFLIVRIEACYGADVSRVEEALANNDLSLRTAAVSKSTVLRIRA